MSNVILQLNVHLGGKGLRKSELLAVNNGRLCESSQHRPS